MYCTKCGNDAGEASFCPVCGAALQFMTTNNNSVEKYNLISAYISMFKKYAKFSGRSRRSEYWFATLAHSIVMLVLGLLMIMPLAMDIALYGEPTEVALSIIPFGYFLSFIYSVATLVPYLALTIRRLHDTGRSGWFYLLSLIPYIGSIVIFVFTVLDSERGINKYGPSPKGI